MRTASTRALTRRPRATRALAPLLAVGLVLAACGGQGEDADETPDAQTGDPAEEPAPDDGDTAPEDGTDDDAAAPQEVEVPDGPEIVVSSFNFPESTILAEIYGQVLEDRGYPVGRELDLGARELIFPELSAGNLDLLPEYLGSALVVGFGEEAPEDVDRGVEALRDAFEADGVSVLEPAPAENANAFVTSDTFADEHGVSTLEDLADVGTITFAGPPECEERDTCLLGLTEGYGLDVQFESIQEAGARLAALQAGDVDLILLFSTDAVLADESLVHLDDPDAIVPPENIVPVVRTEIVDAYGDDLVGLIDDVSSSITTEVLIELNTRAQEGLAPDQIAGDWLAEQGLVG
ncbi:ABC transporter substrate-binding protein [Egicoccus halophilus]|uniref:Glycine/betaine ABC transporter substrate-binding protein n=1 Tax=Egicoccus halophilus TaxID=1670830 RepID=A0A8J3AD12_9ACTN|nr:ABC transporter substrate-binding protein [Egicoccus halophilus]GGI04853.1 glycine/betaine ABC transporter substrate-binding protein [Egicoccus halophilus]